MTLKSLTPEGFNYQWISGGIQYYTDKIVFRFFYNGKWDLWTKEQPWHNAKKTAEGNYKTYSDIKEIISQQKQTT